MFSKLITTLTISVFCVVVLGGTIPAPRKADVLVPISPVGAISAQQGNTGETRLYWQNADASITEVGVNGPLTTGILDISTTPVVPASEALLGTPIATVVDLDSSGSITEIRTYFFSPTWILSEYIQQPRQPANRGGPSCTDCITTLQFGVKPGSTALYALRDDAATGLIRVGFISAGAPTTISEAVFTTKGGWQLGQLHNA
ncbi:hypothetical protein DFH09DRAFT_1354922 [Mycena vulgaris]|nr:hypothetical protein DFH09DRAFT_1354922 [Mycena vulgaris]